MDIRTSLRSDGPKQRPPTLERIRAATAHLHERLDQRLDAVRRLADPDEREAMIGRYAAFYLPADAALAPFLMGVPGLDFAARSRASSFGPEARSGALPAFPSPASRAEALGMLYVLEGSTLGGRMIARALDARGISDPRLRFLDPYGPETGTRWRGFLQVLEGEVGDEAQKEDACRGGVTGFLHAERVLCGDAA